MSGVRMTTLKTVGATIGVIDPHGVGRATQSLPISSAPLSSASPVKTVGIEISAQALALYQVKAAGTMPTYSVADALKQGASVADGALVISDTSANLAKNFDALVGLQDKIGAITQKDAKALALTEAQFVAGRALLSKINSGGYSVALTGVHASNLKSLLTYDTNIVAITVSDTSEQIAAKLADVSALGTKVTALTQTTKSAMSLAYVDVLKYASVLSRIDKGAYTLNLTDEAKNLKANLVAVGKLGAKVATITQTDTSTAIKLGLSELTANLATLKKINGGAFQVDIEDTGAAVAKAWATITAIGGNLHGVKLTDAAPSLTLSAAQVSSGAGLISKISNDSYALSVSDTAANITSNLSSLVSAGGAITKVTQTDKANITVSADQLTSGSLDAFLGKLSSESYGIAVTGATKSNVVGVLGNAHVKSIALQINDGMLSSSDVSVGAALSNSKITAIALENVAMANLAGLAADVRVKSIGVRDSSENLTNATNLAAIDVLMKKRKGLITAVNLDSDTHGLINVDAATYSKYAATIYTAPKNYALQVDLSASVAGLQLPDSQLRSAFKTTANANGTFAVQMWDFKKGGYQKAITFNAGVNFLKLGAVSTFLDSGDAKLNAVLNVGSFQWEQNPAQKTADTSSYEIKPGVFALKDGTAKQVIKYKFLPDKTDPALSTSDQKGFLAMSADQVASVKNALSYISSLVNIQFELTSTGAADINFGTNDQGTVSGGYATGANPAMSNTGSVNLLLNKVTAVNNKPTQGDYGWETLIHEIGHTLGLKHPGAYNAGGGAATGPYLSATDDNRRNTVMSYYDAADSKNWTNTSGSSYSYAAVNPRTYMPLDILALQFLYGKNTTGTSLTDSSKTLDTFQTTTFNAAWAGMETLSSTANGVAVDLSGVHASNIVDLRAGAFSSINIKDATYNAQLGTAKTPQTFYNINNVGLSYDASIASLIGGTGRDVVYVTNKSVDIDGGTGADKVYLYGSASEWTKTENGDETRYTNGAVTATLKSIEAVSYYDMSSTAVMHSRVDLTA